MALKELVAGSALGLIEPPVFSLLPSSSHFSLFPFETQCDYNISNNFSCGPLKVRVEKVVSRDFKSVSGSHEDKSTLKREYIGQSHLIPVQLNSIIRVGFSSSRLLTVFLAWWYHWMKRLDGMQGSYAVNELSSSDTNT